MKYQLFFSIEAMEDYAKAIDYYRAVNPVLAGRFRQQLNKITTNLKQSPSLYQFFDDPIRRAHLSVFPYTVFYTVSAEDSVEILALFHQSKAPSDISGRLGVKHDA